MRRATLSAMASPRSTSCWSEKIFNSCGTGWMAGGTGQFCCDASETVNNGIVNSVNARLTIIRDPLLEVETGEALRTRLALLRVDRHHVRFGKWSIELFAPILLQRASVLSLLLSMLWAIR